MLWQSGAGQQHRGLLAVPHPEQQADLVLGDATADERQDVPALPVKPLRVVDDQHPSVAGRTGHRVECGPRQPVPLDGAAGLGRPPETRYQPVDGITPRLQRVLDGMPLSPAIIKTAMWDVVGWNRAAAALLTDYGTLRRIWAGTMDQRENGIGGERLRAAGWGPHPSARPG